MSDFLLELRCEEIPARMQAGARLDLVKLFRAEMEAAGVVPGGVTVWSTPRRLALIARDLPDATAPASEELKGPRTSAPEQALEGFLRKTGLAKEQLIDRDGTWFACFEKPGRAMADVLADAIPMIAYRFPWPKSQRWGAASIETASLRWVRPLSGIVAILGEELVDCEIEGLRSSFATRGHRFHHPGEITIGGVHDYQDKLRACHVLVDHAERETLIRERAIAAAAQAGLTLVADEGLVAENAGLTEWPVPLLGRFDEEFLEVPPEVIQLTARVNQKYFVCESASGILANAFVCTANIDAKDGGEAIIAGNRKVLAARLSDARFFWQQDLKKSLAEHAEGLKRITFHEKLGTVADKVERVARLAEWLSDQGVVPNCDPVLARKAAELCKADLVTEMVGEFPELQGLMGGYYARAEGLPDEVADAIRDHYKPVGQGDEVPTAPVTVAVSLADKLDTLVGFFMIDERPTGSKDPFALRRAALGVIRTIMASGLRIRLAQIVSQQTFGRVRSISEHRIDRQVVDFFADRLKVQQREAGVRHDLIDAVTVLVEEDDLISLLARVHALQAFVSTPDGANLLAGYKRAANILKKESSPEREGRPAKLVEGQVAASISSPALDSPTVPLHHPADGSPPRSGEDLALPYTPDPAEQVLIDALAAAAPRAAQAVEAEDFAEAMTALASLRAPIDAFFDQVTVNDADPAKRAARLALLESFRNAVHRVADFSRIEG